MDFLLRQGAELWSAVTTPQAVDLVTRIKWLIVVGVVFYWVGLLIGQTALSGNGAYYPKDRFRIATAWTMTVFAFALTAVMGIGWWRHGQTPWAALGVHVAALSLAILVALLLVPPKPDASRGMTRTT